MRFARTPPSHTRTLRSGEVDHPLQLALPLLETPTQPPQRRVPLLRDDDEEEGESDGQDRETAGPAACVSKT